MTKSPPRKRSTRKRHLTARLSQYDHSQGALTRLAKSIGRPESPPSAQSQMAARGKKQATAAARRGNTSRPGALQPLLQRSERGDSDEDVPDETMAGDDDAPGETMRGDDDVPEETMRGDDDAPDETTGGDYGEGNSDGDDGEGNRDRDDDEDKDKDERSLLDYPLDQLHDEALRIEWLRRAINMWGGRRNYCEDPAFQDEHSLRKEWKRLVMRDSAGRSQPPAPETTHRIQKGQTYILQPQTAGHSSRVRLHRTDNETLALDGKRVGSEDLHEYGDSVPARLTRTNQTTIGLDGRLVSPPRRGPSGVTSRPNHPTGAKRAGEDIAIPSKKRAITSHARVEETRTKDRTTGARPASSRSAPKPLQPHPQAHHSPSPDATMQDASGNDAEPPSTAVNPEDRLSSPPASDDNVSRQSSRERNSDDEPKGARNNGDDPVGYDKLTKRQRTQLHAFSPEAREVVQWVFDKVKLDLASVCPFSDNMTEGPEDNTPILDRWILRLWNEANDKVREGKAPLPLKDEYAVYIQKQLPGLRNSMRKACEHLVSVYYGLRRSKPNHATLAKDLTDDGEERWLSSNKKNDSEMFMHPIIADTIENAFFKTAKSFGFKNLARFIPLVPVPTIAYACSIIRNRIKAFETDISKPADLNSESDRDAYKMYMTMLDDIRRDNPVHLLRIWATITLQYLKAKPKPTVLLVPELNLGPDCDMPMDSLEEISDLLGDEAPALNEWDGVKEALRKSKGKAPARDGPSGLAR
ncbi:hypothetical protein RhiJN_27851 [Ceratobasidium sp. AG-Ba]|nr:hypothetical protein RhiJN_27851 [Ceratobasidium sp. AG-Ba]